MTGFDALEVDGRAVLVRADFNVPLADGQVTSDARIRAVLPTIKALRARGARVTLASHLGRPDGRRHPKYSMAPVAARLSELLGDDVELSDNCVGDGVLRLVRTLRPDQLLLLENLRFHAGEEKNDVEFAKALARPFDVYVNDAFAVSHRAHASVDALPRRMRTKACGPLMQREVLSLRRILDAPRQGFVAILGGAKVSDKLPVITALLDRVETLCIGGAMALTFLKAQGVSVGASKVEASRLHTASEILQRAQVRGVRVSLPLDHVVAKTMNEDAAEITSDVLVPPDRAAFDIGPKTRLLFSELVRTAETVFWNGPVGVFENERFAAGTLAVADAVTLCAGFTLVGGGDSVLALEKANATERVSFVSTGGGASLELLGQGTLPGIEALGPLQ